MPLNFISIESLTNGEIIALDALEIVSIPHISIIDEREKNVIIARYGLNGVKAKTLEELGAEYKLTKERIRQIEQAALHKLRNPRRLDTLRVHI